MRSATRSAPVTRPLYRRRDPENTVLHRVMRQHLATFLALADARQEIDPSARQLPGFVRRELERYLDCGILARG